MVEPDARRGDAHARLQDLLRLHHDVVGPLDLDTVLHRIVRAGVEIVDARYGALGVLGTGQRLERFVHVGMDVATVDRIAHLPRGEGLLGALIDDPRPVRLTDLSHDPRSSGFPPHHPPMRSFIGVPVRVRGEVFGNLYLTDSRHGDFTEDDAELARSLAATAGVAIANARLLEDATYRARWSTALVDVSRSLLTADDGEELDLLLDRLHELARTDLVSLSLVDEDERTLTVDRALGHGSGPLVGTSFEIAGSIVAEPLATGRPLLVRDLSEHPDERVELLSTLGNGMLIPFTTTAGTQGLLCAARSKTREAFEARDVDMGVSFAGHVAVALEREESRVARARVALLEDRSRIARDLHDLVIQRLFATGLNLQALAGTTDDVTGERLMDQIAEIDASIAQIRQSIFAMRRTGPATPSSVRSRISEVVERAQPHVPHRVRLDFIGPVDLWADRSLADDLTAVVTEALANAVRHARAQHVQVQVTAVAGRVTLVVEDDGAGLPPSAAAAGNGLANLRDRALARGGELRVEAATPSGTRLTWSAPAD